jgi:formylglycine-generating enzyme required for sulfatase activity
MAWISGGAFRLGSDSGFPEEGPAVEAQVEGFFMDRAEVTNAQFAAFVAATGYRTLAERATPSGSAVFAAQNVRAALGAPVSWWRFMPGADWRHPEGPGSSLAGREQHPVVHVAQQDAQAYAEWKGRSLPTELQFEYAARGSARRDAQGHHQANTWQGQFPARDDAADGHAGTAPVGCYAANAQGLHDMLGNVWEWTVSPYYARHDQQADAAHPRGFDPAQPDEPAVAVVKGGSFLCAPDYCMRYRPEARIAQAPGLSTAHIGFRTVLNP